MKGDSVEMGLAVVKGVPDAGRVVAIRPGGRLVLGRQPGSGLLLACTAVSRSHCEVWRDGDGVWARDLQSRGGIWVNQSQAPWGRVVALRPCDWLGVGGVLLRLVFLGPAEPAWLADGDGAVGKVARAVREEGWGGHGQVLHDALLDAGCCDRDVLGHCLAPCPSEEGCSLLDLLLASGGEQPL